MTHRTTLRLPSPRLLGPIDPAWPRALGELRDPPLCLHVAGRPPPWPRAVAIVGTRRADEAGLDFVHGLAADLARAGCTVLSGGARGIDAAAHEGALSSGGTTVAVLATGLAHPYPKEHGPLFERIVASGGALASEEADCAPHRGRFLGRNRLIAALARAVVVVQAPRRSGALSTAARAKRLGRPVLVAPAAPWDPRAEGSLALLRGGAAICTGPRDVLLLPALGGGDGPAGPVASTEKMNSTPDLTPDTQAVFRELGPRPRHVDDLVRATALPAAAVQGALVELCLMGFATEGAGGRFRLPPPDPTPEDPS